MTLSVHPLPDGAPAWLKAAGNDLADDPEVSRVGHLLPAGHDAYLRLFHPFVPWGSDPESAPEGKRRTWQSLAEEAGAQYHGALQWDTLDPVLPVRDDARPFEVHQGELEAVTRRRLFVHLPAITRAQPVYFLYDLAAIVFGGEPVLVESAIDAVEDVVAWAAKEEVAAVSTPEFVWPADRSWIVCTDYDLTSTYLAGPRALADTLLGDPQLEVIEVDRMTRIDYRADELNRPAST